MFKLQSPSKYSPFDAIHLSRCWSHCSKQCLNLSILIPSSAFDIVSPHPHGQSVSFCGLSFFWGNNNKKIAQCKIWQIGRVGHGGCAVFRQKLLNTQHGVVRCACKSPVMKWANALKSQSLQKNFTEAEHNLSQQRQLVH